MNMPGDLTEKERAGLVSLRAAIADVEAADPLDKDDLTLIRFLRARDGNIRKSSKMWKDYVEWKDKYGANEVRFLRGFMR